MVIVKSKNNVSIRLTTEKWEHIVTRHPEMLDQKEHVLETIGNPYVIQQGDFDELIAIRFYEKTLLHQNIWLLYIKRLAV
jgi:LysM repeat protein